MAPRSEVLIIGAGPTGLVLALWLTKLGVRVRIIDKAAEAGQTSRALAVQARTLELYRQMGIADDVVARGVPGTAVNIWVNGSRRGHAAFGAAGKGISPFPYALVYPQDEHERMLIRHLAAAGVDVERRLEAVALEQSPDGVSVRVRRPDGSLETCDADYLAGCDGAHSFVREALGIGFPGGTYSHLFYVADVEAHGPAANDELNLALEESDFFFWFPLKDRAHGRLIGTVREQALQQGETLECDDVDQSILEHLRMNVTNVNWFSTYRVHHRVASSFRVGRAFLLGDAAHIHSPVGGQGMNTGIGDAVNLAWKLAAVLHGEAPRALLDSYADERVPFAQRLVNTTDRAFALMTARGGIATFVRRRIMPRLATMLIRLKPVRRLMFRTISQVNVNYRAAALNEGHAGGVRGGDRLPWVSGLDNFAPLASFRWQAHVYGDASPSLRAACESRNVELYTFPWTGEAKNAGLARNALYLVRPDGYVALAAGGDEAEGRLRVYAEKRGLRPATAAARPPRQVAAEPAGESAGAPSRPI